MALGSTDERDLLLPLFTGIEEDPLWDTFLHRLLARTKAQRLCLLVRPAGVAGAPSIRRLVTTRGDGGGEAPFDIEEFSEAGLIPYATLRPNRVYSLEETTIPDSAETVRRQREVLDDAAVADARFIRIVSRGDHNAWLVLLHDRRAFEASDSALLSSLAPHFALALAMLMELRALRMRAAAAEDALKLLGIGQVILDAEGHILLADPISAQELDVQSTGRPQIKAGAAQALNAACRELASAAPEARRTVRFDDRLGKDVLLRRAPIGVGSALSDTFSIGLVRQPRRENPASAAQVVALTLGLSRREAALAVAIGQGRSIVEAGAELQLTQETARNYSKRIYAKTGTTGQADLVRLLLTGLSPFA